MEGPGACQVLCWPPGLGWGWGWPARCQWQWGAERAEGPAALVASPVMPLSAGPRGQWAAPLRHPRKG